MQQASLLFVPGVGGSGPAHWQSLWHQGLPRAFWTPQLDWDCPLAEDWVAGLDGALDLSGARVVSASHGELALAATFTVNVIAL